MRVSPTAGLCVSVLAFILGVLGTILPYWTSEEVDGVVHHEGLWRNCTVYTKSFDCMNVKHGQAWFHVVQGFIVTGVLVQLLTVISGCVFHSGEYGRKVGVTFSFCSLAGGVITLAGVIVFAMGNKEHADIFSAGFYLTIISVISSLTAAILGLLAVYTTRSRYVTFGQ